MKKKIFYGWWIVLATNIICLLGFGTWLYSFGLFFKPMMAEFGWTRASTSLAASFRSVEGGIAGPIVGWAVDKYGSRGVVFFGGVISGIGFILMFFIDHIPINPLYSFYIIYGIIISIGMSAMLYLPAFVVIAKWFNRKLSRAYMVLAVGAGLSGIICAPAINALIERYGWRVAYLVIGIVIWIVVLPLSMVIKESPEKMGLRPDGDPPANDTAEETEAGGDNQEFAGSTDFTLKQAVSTLTFWVIAVTFFFQSLGHSVVFVHAVPVLTDAGISAKMAALSIGLLTTVSLAGRLVLGYLGDFMDKRYLFSVAYILMGSGVFVLLNAREMFEVYIFIALFGVGFGATIPLMAAMRAEYFGRKALGKIQGFMSPITMIAGATGPYLAGKLFDLKGSYDIPFLCIGCFLFIAGILIIFARPVKLKTQPLQN